MLSRQTRLRWHSNSAPALQGAGERHLVGVLEVAAHGNALGDARDAHAERLYQPRDVQRRRLSFDGRIGGDDDFLDSVMEARDQLFELQLVGSHAVERRKGAVEDVVSAAELARPLDGEQDGEARDRIGHFGKPGIIPPRPEAMPESGFSAAAASCAALRAEFTAATTRSSSIGTSRGSTACLSICTLWISPLPLAVTTTMPPPAVPVTVFCASRSCASRICSWSCWACWKSASKSKPAIVSTPLPDRERLRSRRRGPRPRRAPPGARGRAQSALRMPLPAASVSAPRP